MEPTALFEMHNDGSILRLRVCDTMLSIVFMHNSLVYYMDVMPIAARTDPWT